MTSAAHAATSIKRPKMSSTSDHHLPNIIPPTQNPADPSVRGTIPPVILQPWPKHLSLDLTMLDSPAVLCAKEPSGAVVPRADRRASRSGWRAATARVAERPQQEETSCRAQSDAHVRVPALDQGLCAMRSVVAGLVAVQMHLPWGAKVK